VKNGIKVPYDNDPRPLQPANKNLREVRESEGPSPTQDGPHRGTTPVADDMLGYLDAKNPMFNYLNPAEEKQVEK
jgi:hypothetical protein